MSRKILLQGLPLYLLILIVLSDLRPIVVGTLQRGLLATGWWRADVPVMPSPVGLPVQAVSQQGSYPHNLPLLTLDGQPVNLRDLRGKVLFVNLWASWCPPCVAEMPDIYSLYQKMDKSKVAFVMISLDENPTRARALLRRRGYTFPVYFPAAPLPAPFDSNSIPSTIILTPDGTVAARHDGMAEYDTPEFKAALERLVDQ